MEQAEKNFREEHAKHGKLLTSHGEGEKRPYSTFRLTCPKCEPPASFVRLVKRK